MILKYHWEDMVVNVCEPSHTLSPHTSPKRMDVDYDIDVSPTMKDIANYLIPYHLQKQIGKLSQEQEKEIELGDYYMKKVLAFLNSVNAIDYDQLEYDPYFVEFMHDRYEEKALNEFYESNQDY